jgi:hypothetical protein
MSQITNRTHTRRKEAPKNKVTISLLFLFFTSQVFSAALSWLNPPEIDIGLEGNSEDYSALISANGRYVAFGSRSSNLVIDDTNITNDIFLRDLQSNEMKLVTTNSSGVQISYSSISRPTNNGDQIAIISRDENLPNRPVSASSFDDFLYIKEILTGNIHTPLFAGEAIQTLRNGKVFISSSGQFIYFTSLVDLVANDTNAKSDVYIYDRSDSSFELVSINSSGVATGSAELLSISNNGRYLTYEADDGSPGAPPKHGYVHDLNFSTTVMYTVDNNGDPVNHSTDATEVSNNGIVYFCSSNDTIVAGDTNGLADFFVYNAGVVTFISFPNISGVITDNGCSFISKVFVNNTDTKFYFYHLSNQIDPSITNDLYYKMVFVNLTTQQSRVVNQINNEYMKIDSFNIDASNNLNDVAFISTSTANITNLDSTRAKTLHYSTQNDQFDVVPVAAFSPQTQNSGASGVMSQNLNWVAYTSSANNVIENNTSIASSSVTNLYLINRSTSETTQIGENINYGFDISPNGRYVAFLSNYSQGAISVLLDDTYLFLYDRNDSSYSQIVNQANFPKVNDDGNIVFYSNNSTLVVNDNNGHDDIFLYVKNTSSVQRISVDTNGNDADSDSRFPDIGGSGNSTWIVFESDASDLITADNNGFRDIFLTNWPAGQIVRVSEISGVGGNGFSQQARISNDTSTIVFLAYAENLVGEVIGVNGQVAVYDRVLTSLSIISRDSLGNLQDSSRSYRAFTSSSGRFIAFQSESELVSSDVPSNLPETDVYVYDRQESQMIRMTQYDNGGNYNSDSTLLDLAVDTSQSTPLIGSMFGNKDFLINDYFNLNVAENGENALYLMQSGGEGKTVNVTITGTGAISGTLGLNCSDNCSQTYVLGQTVSLLATADAGTSFIHWQGDVCHNSTALTCEIYVNSDKSVEAVFTLDNDTIFNNGFEN